MPTVDSYSPSIRAYKSAKPHPGRRTGGQRIRGIASGGDGSAPTISIVTVVLDADDLLGSTLRSVSSQDYENVEHIVVDGNSVDDTVAVIEAHEDRLAYWLSEPDRGIYDAMNKGISLATGDVVGLLNAGDVYTPGTLTRVAQAFRQMGPQQIIYGDMLKYFVEVDMELYSRAELLPMSYTCTIPHPSVFVPMAIYKESGLYSLRYSVASDYVFLASQYLRGRRFHHIEASLSVFRNDGLSTRLKGYVRSQLEVVDFHRSSGSGEAWRAAAYAAYHILIRCVMSTLKSLLGTRLSARIVSWRLRRHGACRARQTHSTGALPT